MENLQESLHTLFFTYPILASFLAGILSFLSPCILPLIPAYISYISGISSKNFEFSSIKTRIAILLKSLFFVCGFCVVFFTLALFIQTPLGAWFNSTFFAYTAGALIILFGLHTLGIFRINLFNKLMLKINIPSFSETKILANIFAPFLLGVSFGASFSPCTGPILAAIIALGISVPAESAPLYYMASYCVGLGLCFLLCATLLNRALEFLARLKTHMRIVEVMSGILLIGFGIFIVGSKVDWITNLLR